jgi:hypothetical protein
MWITSIANKYGTSVVVNGSGKHSSLLRHGNNYYNKKFYSKGHWGLYNKTFNGRNLQIFRNKLEYLLLASLLSLV